MSEVLARDIRQDGGDSIILRKGKHEQDIQQPLQTLVLSLPELQDELSPKSEKSTVPFFFFYNPLFRSNSAQGK